MFLGNKLAETLGVKRGDEVRLIIPGVSQLTPMGRIPSQRLFTVAGIFQTNGKRIRVNWSWHNKMPHVCYVIPQATLLVALILDEPF